jgi:hypothetical protein
MANKQNSNKGQIIRRTIKGEVKFFKNSKPIPNKSAEPRFEKQQQRKAELARQARIIKKFVSKTGEERFTQGGKRLPNKKGAQSFKRQQAAFKQFRFADGRPVSRDVNQTILNNQNLLDILPNKILPNNPEFFDVNDNETALSVLDEILQRISKTKTAVTTLIRNDELHPRDDFKFKVNQPIAIYELTQELNSMKPKEGDPPMPKKGIKLKVIKLDGSELVGREAKKYLEAWNLSKFEEIKKKYPDAVGGVIKYPHKFISPFLIIDLRLVDDKDIDVFDSNPKRTKGNRVVRYNKFRRFR